MKQQMAVTKHGNLQYRVFSGSHPSNYEPHLTVCSLRWGLTKEINQPCILVFNKKTENIHFCPHATNPNKKKIKVWLPILYDHMVYVLVQLLPKLRPVKRGSYLDGRLPGNTLCCNFPFLHLVPFVLYSPHCAQLNYCCSWFLSKNNKPKIWITCMFTD